MNCEKLNYEFFNLNPSQMEEVRALKSAGETSTHGSLGMDEIVDIHSHGQKAMYVVQGIADFYGIGVREVLSNNGELNTVLVEANQVHGWRSRLAGTEIDQVHGITLVERVLAAV